MRVRAMRMLARREYSRHELQVRLSAPDADPAEVQEVLDEFEAKGWLSEQRFVDSVVRARRQRFGTARVLRELRDKGVSDEGLGEAREALAAGELDAARQVWQKKYGQAPLSLAERAKQTRFLAGRGFSADVIRRILDGRED